MNIQHTDQTKKSTGLPRTAMVSVLALMVAASTLPAAAQEDGQVAVVPRDAAEGVKSTLPELLTGLGQAFASHGNALEDARDDLEKCRVAASMVATTAGINAGAAPTAAVPGSNPLLNEGACLVSYFDRRVSIAQGVAQTGLAAEQDLLAQHRDVTEAITAMQEVRAEAEAEAAASLAQRDALLEGFRTEAARLSATPRDEWTREDQLSDGQFRRLLASVVGNERAADLKAANANEREELFSDLDETLVSYATGIGEIARDQQLVIEGSLHAMTAIEDGAGVDLATGKHVAVVRGHVRHPWRSDADQRR